MLKEDRIGLLIVARICRHVIKHKRAKPETTIVLSASGCGGRVPLLAVFPEPKDGVTELSVVAGLLQLIALCS